MYISTVFGEVVTFTCESENDCTQLKRILEVMEHGGTIECRPNNGEATTLTYKGGIKEQH